MNDTNQKPRLFMFSPGTNVTPELIEAAKKLLADAVPSESAKIGAELPAWTQRKSAQKLADAIEAAVDSLDLTKFTSKAAIATEFAHRPICVPSAQPIMVVDSLDGEAQGGYAPGGTYNVGEAPLPDSFPGPSNMTEEEYPGGSSLTILEMIDVWRQGCSNTIRAIDGKLVNEHPEQCEACTVGLIEAIERKAKAMEAGDE